MQSGELKMYKRQVIQNAIDTHFNKNQCKNFKKLSFQTLLTISEQIKQKGEDVT